MRRKKTVIAIAPAAEIVAIINISQISQKVSLTLLVPNVDIYTQKRLKHCKATKIGKTTAWAGHEEHQHFLLSSKITRNLVFILI